MITFNIITLFPQLFNEFLNTLPYKRAIEKGLVKVNLVNLRDFAVDKRGSVDDKVYGGGTGMLIRIEPVYNALESILGTNFIKNTNDENRIVLLTPRGKLYDQRKAEDLLRCKNITIICGRYEGIDARVEENLVTDVISIGNYVVSGGELPALTIMESIVRLIPGVLEKEDATKIESFQNDSIEYPQYTRPEEFKGLKVPETLKQGNHKEIDKWRKSNERKIKSS